MNTITTPALARFTIITLLLITRALAAEPTLPAAPANQWKYHNPTLSLNLRARSPDQIAAFYTARKFPAAMIELLSGLCFITTRVSNHSDEILRMDLQSWRFSNTDGPIERLDRDWLASQLDTIDAPAASRATLRWTLLPEKLDFRPQEQEGGNLLLPRVSGPFRLEAVFSNGPGSDGKQLRLSIDKLQCAENTQ